jgi:hypothetical protein
MRANKVLGLVLLFIAAVVASGQACADQNGYTIGSLDEANGAATFYKAEAAAGDARAKAEAVHSGLPALRQIIVVETPASGEQTVAVFYSNGGGRFEVQEGDPLLGYIVKKIDSARNRVQLERGKKAIWVSYMRGGGEEE